MKRVVLVLFVLLLASAPALACDQVFAVRAQAVVVSHPVVLQQQSFAVVQPLVAVQAVAVPVFQQVVVQRQVVQKVVVQRQPLIQINRFR